ncbi:unnamed protein product [Cuscuta campestris]|uniref:Exostosin GT47 domain-containing protein n=1 Tax=Cuscuta campestris TaxID=132261 RepID=A0A484ND55_9ASTE|nr:unnamed protein product [Cuscuta campestris]
MPKNNNMENPIAPRWFPSKFWFVFFVMFLFWYVLIYGLDWFSFPRTSLLSKQETIISIESFNVDPVNTIKNRESGVHHQKPRKKPCDGRYIYVHDLPSRFNEDLVRDCKVLSRWVDMCEYLVNMGMGHDLGDSFHEKGWFSTNQFSLEPLFHARIRRYKCLTNDSSEASAVFLPYYAGLDVGRYLWGGFNVSVRDSGALDLAKWVKERPEWAVMGGRDHFVVAGRITWDFRRLDDDNGESSWGNKLMLLPEVRNMTVLTIESSPWSKNDFAIPYPSYFHPSNDRQVTRWQDRMRRQRRRTLFSFAGGPRPNMEESIRGQIIRQCLGSTKGKCKLLECKPENKKCDNPFNLMKLFQNSIFCLEPPGDSFTRRSTFDAILAGCIPVFFTPASAYVQYIWNLPRNHTSYSVLIPEDDVKENKANIEKILSQISKSRVAEMREEVIRMIPKVVYADPREKMEKIKDAFDLAIEGVLDKVGKVRKEMSEGKKKDWSVDFDEENSWKYYTFGSLEKHEWDHFFRRSPN